MALTERIDTRLIGVNQELPMNPSEQGFNYGQQLQGQRENQLLSQLASSSTVDGQVDYNLLAGNVAAHPGISGATKLKIVEQVQPMAEQQAINKALANSGGDIMKFLKDPNSQQYQSSKIKIAQGLQDHAREVLDKQRGFLAEQAARYEQATDDTEKQYILNTANTGLATIYGEKLLVTPESLIEYKKALTPEEKTAAETQKEKATLDAEEMSLKERQQAWKEQHGETTEKQAEEKIQIQKNKPVSAGQGGAQRGLPVQVQLLVQKNKEFNTQNQKLQQAAHARQLYDQSINPSTGQPELNSLVTGEMAKVVSSLIAGGSQATVHELEMMDQKSLYRYINSKIAYVTSKPVPVEPVEWAKTFKEIIDRQGTVAEDLRDGAVGQIIKTAVEPDKTTTPEQKKEIIDGLHSFNSFKKTYLKSSGNQPNPQTNDAMIAKAKKALNDPKAPEAAKAAARKVLGMK